MKNYTKKITKLLLTGLLAFGLSNIAHAQTTNTKQNLQVDNYNNR